MPSAPTADLTAHLLDRLRAVQQALGVEPTGRADALLADVLDSMGLVEFVAVVADDCGVSPEVVEDSVGRRFTTVADLARALAAAGIAVQAAAKQPAASAKDERPRPAASAWLGSVAVRLPDAIQRASEINVLLGRPPGWLERHAGIRQRHIWADQDCLAAAADAGRECLDQTGLLLEEVGMLLVTSEAPPLLIGLAAALHHRLGLRAATPAVEVGGACTGFLAAWRLAQGLLPQVGPVLIVAVEAPSRWLTLQPGPAGEAAALFGEAAAACVLTPDAMTADAVPLHDVELAADGTGADLVRVERTAGGMVEVLLSGQPLAGRAIQVMNHAVRDLLHAHRLTLADIAAVVAHGGNGRLPALLARQLGLELDKVWSETATDRQPWLGVAAGGVGGASTHVKAGLVDRGWRGADVGSGTDGAIGWGERITSARARSFVVACFAAVTYHPVRRMA